MPVLNPQEAPQEAPQQGPDPLTSGQAVLSQFGFGQKVDTPRTLLSALIEENLRSEREQANKPVFKGFMRDLVNTTVGSAQDIYRALFQGEVLDFDPAGSSVVMQDMMAVQTEAQQRLENETNPSIIDLTAATFTKGVVSGFDFGLRNLPVVGDFFHSYLGPANEAFEIASHNAMSRSLNAMNSKFGQATLTEVPAIASGLTGTLTGGYLTIKPWLGLGNVLLAGGTRVRGAKNFAEALQGIRQSMTSVQSGFMGDIAGSSIFGFATGERGFISGAAEGPVEDRYGSRRLEMPVDPTDPWWKQSLAHTVNRSEAAFFMGADTFLLSALFTTGFAMMKMGSYSTAKMKNMRTDLLGGDPVDAAKIMAMRQAGILTTPGRRQFAVLRNRGEAEAYVDMMVTDELIASSPGAQRILSEQASVEGIVSYHSQLAALAKAVDEIHVSGEATHGVLRGVEDPYRMLQEVLEATKQPNKSSAIPVATRTAEEAAQAQAINERIRILTDRKKALRERRDDIGEKSRQQWTEEEEHAWYALNDRMKEVQSQIDQADIELGQVPSTATIPKPDTPTISPPLEARTTFRAQREFKPLVHQVDEIPEQGLFGYTEGWTRDALTEHVRSVDRRVPIFLKNRPKAPAVERGNVEEVVVVPGKAWEFDSWNLVMEKYGSVDDMMRAARKNNVDVVNVNNTGAEGGVQHIILDPAAIKSSKPVTPSSVGRLMNEPVDADRILAELGEEPLEVALKRRMPEYRFETPIRREDGTYDVIFAPEGAPGLSNKQLKQFKDTGFFSGQRVMYGGKTWEVVGRKGKGGKGKTIEIRDPTTGVSKSVSVANVFEYPSATLPVEVDDALYRDWLEYFDSKLKMVGDRQPDEATLRGIAMATDDPARLNRDFADRGLNAVIHPHEMMAELDVADALAARIKEIDTQLQQIGMDFNQAAQIQTLIGERNALQSQVQASAIRAQQEGRITESIDLEKAFVDFPDEMDYGTVVFQDWARARNIELNAGEAQALKHTFYRRMNEEVFSRLPDDLQANYRAIQSELVDHFEKVPQNLDTAAAMAGFEVMRLKNNTIVLRRPGSLHYEGMFASEEAADAALRRSLRYGGTPNMTPQYNWLDISLPTVPEHGAIAGANVSDLHYLDSDEARSFMSYVQEWSSGKWVTGKPKWLSDFEARTGIPLWTEFVEPLFTKEVHASNQQIPFLERWIGAFKGLGRGAASMDSKLRIKDFIRTIESHTEFLDIDKVVTRAKEAGLNSDEIHTLREMRSVMDEMFQIGTRLYGWTPDDFIYSYLTKLWPQNQAYMRGDLVAKDRRRMYAGLVPDEMDVFVSKYSRNEGGHMLPFEEEDPLLIGMKYIRTFFHEAHVRKPYEKLANFLNVKLKDLPPEQANKIVEEMAPTVRRQLAGAHQGNIMNSFALPNTVRMPLKEMQQYMRGIPDEGEDLAIKMVRNFGSLLGMKMDERTASQVVNSGMLGIYGSTLALRPKPVVRNTVQVIQNLGSRTSFAAVDIGMARATKPEAFARAVDDGIIDMTARGLPFGEEMTIQALESGPIETRGLWGSFWSGMLRATVLDGGVARFWRRLSEKGLAGIGRTDMYTRVAAAETADVFVRPWAVKYEAGKIDADRLVQKALPYWETPIRNKFVSLMDDNGIEDAMRYIRRESSNIANFIYSKPAQPSGMQRPVGRAFWQFGIWPIWRKDLMVRSLKNARSLDEKAAYIAKEGMVAAALALVGVRLGINMAPWMAHDAMLTYAGGPLTQVVADTHDFLSQRSYPQKVEAMKRLTGNMIRMAPAGRFFMEDVVKSIQYAEDDPVRGFLHMFYGRPVTDDLSWSERMIFMMDQHEKEQAALRARSGGEIGPRTPGVESELPVIGPPPRPQSSQPLPGGIPLP